MKSRCDVNLALAISYKYQLFKYSEYKLVQSSFNCFVATSSAALIMQIFMQHRKCTIVDILIPSHKYQNRAEIIGCCLNSFFEFQLL